MRNDGYLFGSISLDDEWVRRREAMEARCAQVSAEQILHGDLEALSDEYAAPFQFDPPELLKDQLYGDEPVISLNGEATVSLYIPCSGDTALLPIYHRTRPMHMTRPRYSATLSKGLITLKIAVQQHELVKETERIRNEVFTHADTYLPEVRKVMKEHYNPRFRQFAMNAFLNRKKDLEEKQKVKAGFGSLGFPIRKRADEPAQVFVPVQRKVIALPESKKPEENKYLEQKAYDDILSTIAAMGHGIERSPDTFKNMDEEDIRIILLVGLNAVYEGKATGETFNGYGKTDILIRVADKNIFIAECLVWRGEKYFKSKIEPQLFNYAMWRDTKTALIVFNRNKNFTAVVAEMRDILRTHPQCIQETGRDGTTTKYLFRRHDDPAQQFLLTALAFDVPS
jgi:hypothetical protein